MSAVRLVAVICLGLLAACGGGREELPAIRLIDLAADAEVRWPRQRERRLPKGIRGPRTFRQLRLARAARVAMYPTPRDGDSRLSLIAPTGTRYDFELTPPADGVLRLSLGYLPPEQEVGPSVVFSVFLTTADGDGGVLLDLEVETRSDGDWRELQLDLAEWAGRPVSLTLKTRSADGGQVWAAWGSPEIVSPSRPEGGPDVVFISLDTLRADRLGSYGYELPTSPHLDRLAERSIRFATAVSQAPWTRPSHRSMFNGLYPSHRDRQTSPFLAETLRERGYRTEALTGGGQMDFRLGFERGFDTYRVFDWINDLGELGRWLDGSSGRRRFLFLHTYEIHDPYTHGEYVQAAVPEGSEPRWDKRRYQGLRSRVTEAHKRMASELYDGGIAYTDRQLGELFEMFEERGVFDRAIVVVTSDHGEQFWEHGSWRHGMNLYDHQLLVPLIVHLPPAIRDRLGGGGPGGRVIEEQVRLVDLYPTLLDLLEIPLERRLDGRSLRPLLEGAELPAVDAFAEHLNVRHKQAKALRSKRYKYVYSFPRSGVHPKLRIPERRELYDLTRDPGEQNDLSAERPEVIAELDARLRTLVELLADPSELEMDENPEDLDPDLRERLEALGYVGN